MTPEELRAVADEADFTPDGRGPEHEEGWRRHGEASDWLETHKSDLARLCAELGEALAGISAAWDEGRSAMTLPGTPVKVLLVKLAELEAPK